MTLFVYRLILREESGLLETQGASFREYLRHVPRLVPSLTPRMAAGHQSPRWGQAIIGEAFIWLFGGAVLTFAFTLRFIPVAIMLMVSIAVYFVSALARNICPPQRLDLDRDRRRAVDHPNRRADACATLTAK